MSDAREVFRLAILAALGHAPDDVAFDTLHRFTTGGKSDRSGWCRLFPDGRAGVFGCFRAGVSEVWAALPRQSMSTSERAEIRRQVAQSKMQREAEQRSTWRRNSDRIRFLLRQTKLVVADDPVHRYICRRLAVESCVVPDCLRFHPSMAYTLDGEFVGAWPAMVAPIVSRQGDVLALHRTYLNADGHKAAVPGPVKKLTPAAGLLSGASIPLYPPRAGSIGVSEGIETALAARLASGMPMVAAYSAGALAAWEWPQGVQRLSVFADADPAGATAAGRLEQRARAAGVKVEVLAPSTAGMDWADVWSSRHLQGVA